MENNPELSLFLPVLNEEDNLHPMHAKIKEALESLGKTAEVIYVDDGSTDKSLQVLKEIAAGDSRVRVLSLRRNYGQTAAMSAGIDAAKGEILIPMDADLQNDPKDIAKLLDKLGEGYDVVSGWRKNRQDKLISRKIPSQIANRIISWIGGVPLHDYGCSLKAYRREVIQDVKLYGEMHRFIPIYASWAGARVTEIPVDHHARTMGKSKYGIFANNKSNFRFDDDKIYGIISNETDLRFWHFWHDRVFRVNFSRSLRGIHERSEIFRLSAASSRFCRNAFADFVHYDVCDCSAIFSHGTFGRNDGANLSRITGQGDLRREGKNWL